MKTFVDASAFYALADTTDRHHSATRTVMGRLGIKKAFTLDIPFHIHLFGKENGRRQA